MKEILPTISTRGIGFIALQLLFFLVFSEANSQTTNYSQGGLQVSVFASNPCNGSSNGSIRFTVVTTADGLPATLNLIIGPLSLFAPTPISVGNSFTFNVANTLPAGSYGFIMSSNGGADVVNTFSTSTPVVLTALPNLTVNQISLTNNSSCVSPNGQVVASITGGSQALAGGGSYTYTWTSSNGLAGLPLTNNNFNGLSNLDLATLLSIPGLPGGTYTLSVTDNFSSCTQNRNFIITDPSPSLFNITSGSGTACSGANFTVTLNGTDNTPTNYEILRNGAPTGLIFPGTGGGSFNMTFATIGFTNGDVLTVRATNGFCTPRLMTGSVVLNIASSPTSATLTGTTTICAGQSTNISVAIVGGTAPFSFTITGLGPVAGYASGAPISVSPLTTSIYTLSGLVTDANGCTVAGSGNAAVTVNPTPTAVVSALPGTLCTGSSSTLTFNLTGSGPFNVGYSDGFTTFNLSGIPNGHTVVVTPVVTSTYTITSITDATGCIGLPGSATTITVNPAPVSALLTGTATICAGQSTNLIVTIAGGTPNYGFTITGLGPIGAYTSGSAISVSPAVTTTYTLAGLVTDANGCTVAGSGSVTVTVNPLPTITLGASPSVCVGSLSANLPYSATTGTPNQYSLDFDATANTAGFIDVLNAALPLTPIVITVPGAVAAGIYNANLTVLNNSTGCVSSVSAITVTVLANPTITLGANPSVCSGTTTANLTYSATTGSPDQYSIDFNNAANTAGFVDVTNVALTASPIVITVPGAVAAGIYNATLSVTNSVGGCVSGNSPITVTVLANPTISLGASPTICSGATSANLSYSATTGSPDRYSVDFDLTANGAGFIDVTNAVLPLTPIVLTVPGAAAAGVYNATVTVLNNTTGCISSVNAITITIVSPTITLGANPSVCAGTTTANLTYSATTGSPDQYSIDFNNAANTAGFVDVTNVALTASPIVINVPGAVAAGIYNANLTVLSSSGGCVSPASPITVTVVSSPTITLGVSPSVCSGATTANLTYSATTGSPDQYSIDFNNAANTAGFVDVTNVVLTASPIVINVPGAVAAGIYNATLNVTNSVGGGCVSTNSPITVTVNATPTITLGASPSVCVGSLSANLPYSATTGTPNQYSLDFDATANTAGFIDVLNAALPLTPIVITVPGAVAAGIYNANLTVLNNSTGCVSSVSAITVTVLANPTITLGANPSVCSGTTTANLTYSATTGSPDQYSIDFNNAANTAGFVDVTNVALTASPIVITVPGAVAAGIYNATLSVTNSVGGCVSGNSPITVTVLANPTISLGASPTICSGATSANLSYSATTGSPDRYSVDFDLTANGAGFIDVTNAVLPLTPIVLTVPGAAAAGVYNATVTVLNNTTGCISSVNAITITIVSPTITLGANPSVCAGTTTANLTYSATTGSPDQYSIDFNNAANTAGFVDVTNVALTASPIVINVPGAVAAGIYNANLTVLSSSGGCVSPASPITVTVVSSPTITLGVSPSVCSGATTANLTYSATTGSPDQYSIDFNNAANTAGFVDVTNVVLTASPIVINVPGAVAAGIYNATLNVTNSVGGGCVSTNSPITVTVNATPTITLGASPSVCVGSLSANLPYSATTGTPNQYSLDFDATANTAGFIDVLNAALPLTPIVITVPGAVAAGIYNANLTVLNNSTGCVSSVSAITVTVLANPTITLGANPSVCSGTTTANLTYSATTDSPDQYSIDFNNAANTAGFVDVTNVALTASPIVITVPGAVAAGIYNATLSVTNSVGGCVSGNSPITVTVNSIAPSPGPGIDTWVGDVYSDAGNVASPYENGVDFSVSKYRGFIVESDFTSFGTSTYNSATDAFDLNLSNNIPLAAATICGSYLNNYSIRFRNTKTFASGIYTFNFSSDDGVRFFIDNVAVPLTRVLVTSPANSFTNHSYLGYSSSPICLTGAHDLRIEYFENGGFSRLTADATFQPLTSPTVTTPVSVCVGSTAPTLTATTVDANASGFNWYSSTNVLLFTGASFTPNAAQLNLAVAGATTFNVASIYSCGDGPTTPVVVNVINGISAALVVGATLDPVCIGGSSAITVDLSEAGVSYQLRTGVTPIGSAVIGNGGTINLPTGVLLATTTFNVFASVATCPSIQLTATKDVTVSGSINAGLTVTPLAATICTGNATSIQVATSEVGVNYHLRDNSNNSNIGAAVAGTGGLISLPTGVLVATSTFNVLASSATCSIQLSTTPTVSVSNALNQTLVVSASPNPVCVSGISIVSVALSEVGVSYQLRNGVTAVGAPVVGTGGTINLTTGALFATTIFNVFATLAPCPSVQLTNTVTVNVSGSINSSLAVTSAAPSVCSGSSTNILVANSELGVSYQLRDNLNNSIGLLVAGTGLAAPISLPTGSLSSSGTFNVLASNATCSIQLTSTVSITVDVGPNTTLVVGATITPLCTGGTSAITVSLSENGVTYQLRDGVVNVGAPITGNGGTISLSTGPLLPTTTFNVLATRGTCPPIQLAATQTITVSGSLDSGLTVTAVNPSVCPNTATNVRITASELGVTYQLRNNTTNALVGSALPGTGGNLDLPTGNLAVNTIFNILASNGSCSAQLTNTSSVTVLLASDPLCTGGGTGTCATVVITPVPTPATCTLSNGSINFNINPATPIVNPSGVKITITGISTTNSTIARTNFNNPAFPALPIGVYNYSIEYGDVSCLKTGQVTVDQSGTVGTPLASNILAPVCAGSSTGSLTLDVPGETGNILQWSLDGIAFTNFTAGSTITGVPAGLAPTFQRVISVRRNATDPCNASVTIVIQDANPVISTTLTPTDATCANNDGSILVGTVSGGVGPYTFMLNGTTITLPASNRITAKSGGNYILTVIDSKNCQVDFTTSINFPGLVNYSSVVNNPDCSGSGQNGSIVLTITSTGTFLAGITTDPIAPPTAFQNVVSAGSTPVTFGGLSKGTYYVSLTPTGAACPTKAPFVISSGPDQVDFSLSAINILCFENKGGVAISAIKGSPLVNYVYEIVDAAGAIVPASSVTPPNPINQLQALGTVNLLGLTTGDYKIRLFQDQSVASGCVAPISSTFKSFTVLGPTAALDTLYVTRTISLPDQPTGTMVVGLKESQQTPYQVRLELKKPIDPLQAFLLDYTDFPPRNTQNLKIEYNIRNLFAGLYELKIKDALGCEKTYADIEIKVDVNIFIPNVFTPNEDGSNETFFIRNLPADSKVNISNRWGAEVYSSSNYQNDWNGSNNADGVYFYRIVAGGNTFTGWVEIIRGK